MNELDIDPEIEQIKERREAEKNAVKFIIKRPDSRGALRVVGCVENTEALLKHYSVTVRYNEMIKEKEFTGPFEPHQDTARNAWLVIVRDLARKQGYDPNVAAENVDAIASKNAFHPARDWVLSKPWDGADRIGPLLDTVETVEPEAYKALLVKKWLISAITVLMHGTPYENALTKADGFRGVEGILIFQGAQGLGKTQWLESLVPQRSQWAKDAVTLDPKDKDSVLLAVSYWIVELGEVDATFRKSDIAALKGFATQKSDTVRPPYARAAESFARRTVFTGTVNDPTFLAEHGESRRWWVLGVKSINRDHGIDIQQLWAQVYEQLYMQCVPHWLTPKERELVYKMNEQYEQLDPLQEKLDAYVSLPVPDDSGRSGEWLGAGAIVEILLGQAGNKKDANETSSWLSRKGFARNVRKKYHVRIDYEALQAGHKQTLKKFG